MKNKLFRVAEGSYLILLRELVVQLKCQSIYSGCYKPSVLSLNFNLFPQDIKNKYKLSELNTNSKVNINYITTMYKDTDESGARQFIHRALYDVLLDSKYIKFSGEDYLEFKTETAKKIFLIFKSFKGINASFYDIDSKNIKKALKLYQSDGNYKKEPYNKCYSDSLGPRSILLITPDEDIIYSNRVFLSFEDFFDYDDIKQTFLIKKTKEIISNVYDKVSQNKTFEYSKKMDNEIFKELTKNIDEQIKFTIKELNKLSK